MRGKYKSDEDFVEDFRNLDLREAANAPRNRSHVDEDMTPLPPRP
ncbi:hypothetical protein [Tsukamurella tyrosinosolvens]|nr:hypothetical protein [Tsukamurella tyrosinosolvens]